MFTKRDPNVKVFFPQEKQVWRKSSHSLISRLLLSVFYIVLFYLGLQNMGRTFCSASKKEIEWFATYHWTNIYVAIVFQESRSENDLKNWTTKTKMCRKFKCWKETPGKKRKQSPNVWLYLKTTEIQKKNTQSKYVQWNMNYHFSSYSKPNPQRIKQKRINLYMILPVNIGWFNKLTNCECLTSIYY